MAKNMMKMLKQAQAMQANMEKKQAELAELETEFTAGGLVTAVATGDGILKSIKIDPKVVDPDEVEMLEDLVFTAANGAIQAAKDIAAEEMAKLTAGLNIPGM